MHPQFLLKTLLSIYKKDSDDLNNIIEHHMDAETVGQVIEYVSALSSRTIEQSVIDEQQHQIQHLTEMIDYLHARTHSVMLHWRGIDPESTTLCDVCDGSGTEVEQHDDNNVLIKRLSKPLPCPKCYGSGDRDNPWKPIGTVARGTKS